MSVYMNVCICCDVVSSFSSFFFTHSTHSHSHNNTHIHPRQYLQSNLSFPFHIYTQIYTPAFRDFFDDSARFYHKRSLGKMRAEVVQSPKRTIKEVFENIMNQDDLPRRGDS